MQPSSSTVGQKRRCPEIVQPLVKRKTLTYHHATNRRIIQPAQAAWRPMQCWLPRQGTVFNLLSLSSPHRDFFLIAGKLRGNHLFFFPDLGIHVDEDPLFTRKLQGWSWLPQLPKLILRSTPSLPHHRVTIRTYLSYHHQADSTCW